MSAGSPPPTLGRLQQIWGSLPGDQEGALGAAAEVLGRGEGHWLWAPPPTNLCLCGLPRSRLIEKCNTQSPCPSPSS